jgi:hypothetical protein
MEQQTTALSTPEALDSSAVCNTAGSMPVVGVATTTTEEDEELMDELMREVCLPSPSLKTGTLDMQASMTSTFSISTSTTVSPEPILDLADVRSAAYADVRRLGTGEVVVSLMERTLT